ncbi:Type 2 glycosyltransferase like protein [Verticillium longisporum]|nr:Type 2 glycosyltransferase like protein [Verticillium longisporum]
MFTTWTSLHTFIGLFLFRYTRLVVHIVAYFRHASVLPPISPSLRPIDITVVIATRGDEIANLVSGLESHVNAGCRHISICVPSTRLGRVQAEADLFISKQKDLKVQHSRLQKESSQGFVSWWLFIKTVKRIRLFRRDVRDVLFLPVCILWGYCHDFIKLYALMTRYETGW